MDTLIFIIRLLAIVLKRGFQVPFADKVGEPSCICQQVCEQEPRWQKLLVCEMKLFFNGEVTPSVPPPYSDGVHYQFSRLGNTLTEFINNF